MLATVSLAALLAKSAAINAEMSREAVFPVKSEIVIELRSMTEEDRAKFPGRERFDKTEWYESQQKTVQTVIIPEYVEEWKNNGRDVS
jgi:hypothetical protein